MNRLRASLLVMLAAMLWGTIGVVARLFYDAHEVSPLVLSLFRLGFAVPALGAIHVVQADHQTWRLQRGEVGWWLAAAGSMAAYQLFIFAAVARTTITTAQFLAICTAPVMVAVAAPLLLGERLPARALPAGLLALIGVGLVLGLGNPADLLRRDYLWGNVLALAAAASWAAYAMVARHLVARHHPSQITLITFAGATLLVFPWAAPQLSGLSLSPAGWAMAVYLGAVATALAYLLYVRGLRGITATASVFLALVEPVTAALLAAWLFHERLTPGGWLGVGFLVAGLGWLVLASDARSGSGSATTT
jgi:DME family drug/metabolite transporter